MQSKLVVRQEPEKPWQLSWWRDRSLGPLGGLIAVLVVLGAVVFRTNFYPSISWRLHVHGDQGFALEYPDGWVLEPIDQGQAMLGEAQGVVVSASGVGAKTPRDLEKEADQPVYGVFWYSMDPSVSRATAFQDLRRSARALGAFSPSATRLMAFMDGRAAEQLEGRVGENWVRVVYALAGRTPVVFLSRAPLEDVDGSRNVLDHALSSVKLLAPGDPPRDAATPRAGRQV